MNHYVIRAPRKKKFYGVIDDSGGVLQQVDELGAVNFVAYTPFNPPPYGGMLVARGQYFQSYDWETLTPMTPVALRAYYIPVLIPYPMLIDQLSIFCSTAESNKKCKIGIFSVERGEVSKNIYVNQVGMGSIGERVIPANVSISAGSYAFFFMTEASTAKIYRSSTSTGRLGKVKPWDLRSDGYYWYQDLSTFDDDLDDDPVLTIEETIAGGSNIPAVAARMA